MAKARVPISKLAEAYAIAQKQSVAKAAKETGLSGRTIHTVVWAMEVVPQIKKHLKKENPDSQKVRAS
jgi:molybdenum-dependent DNA-binding transcriptional regulator ModE